MKNLTDRALNLLILTLATMTITLYIIGVDFKGLTSLFEVNLSYSIGFIFLVYGGLILVSSLRFSRLKPNNNSFDRYIDLSEEVSNTQSVAKEDIDNQLNEEVTIDHIIAKNKYSPTNQLTK